MNYHRIRLILYILTVYALSTKSLYSNVSLKEIPLISFVPINTIDTDLAHTHSTPASIYELVDTIPHNKQFQALLPINNKTYLAQNSIPILTDPNQTIFIYCAGWIGHFMGHRYRNKGVGILQGHQYIAKNILNGVTITFDFINDDCDTFTFAQKEAIATLECIIDEVMTRNPTAQLVLVGDCRGGATILHFLTHSDSFHISAIKGVMVECIPLSLKRIARHISDKFFFGLPGTYKIVKTIMRYLLPQHNYTDSKDIFNGKPFPNDIPILISNIDSDNIVSHTDFNYLTNYLKKHGHQDIYRYTASVSFWQKIYDRIYHAKMCKILDYQAVTNAFLQQFDLPHNPEYALTGQQFLKKI